MLLLLLLLVVVVVVPLFLDVWKDGGLHAKDVINQTKIDEANVDISNSLNSSS